MVWYMACGIAVYTRNQQSSTFIYNNIMAKLFCFLFFFSVCLVYETAVGMIFVYVFSFLARHDVVMSMVVVAF